MDDKPLNVSRFEKEKEFQKGNKRYYFAADFTQKLIHFLNQYTVYFLSRDDRLPT